MCARVLVMLRFGSDAAAAVADRAVRAVRRVERCMMPMLMMVIGGNFFVWIVGRGRERGGRNGS